MSYAIISTLSPIAKKELLVDVIKHVRGISDTEIVSQKLITSALAAIDIVRVLKKVKNLPPEVQTALLEFGLEIDETIFMEAVILKQKISRHSAKAV
jgi:hypothetical protein